ncbi:hypothetical protein V8C86DRAFT_2863232 [Haematococcus lacustris]
MTAVRKCGVRRVLATHSQRSSLTALTASLHANASALVVERLRLAQLVWGVPSMVRGLLAALAHAGGPRGEVGHSACVGWAGSQGACSSIASPGRCRGGRAAVGKDAAGCAGFTLPRDTTEQQQAGRLAGGCQVILCADLVNAVLAELPGQGVGSEDAAIKVEGARQAWQVRSARDDDVGVSPADAEQAWTRALRSVLSGARWAALGVLASDVFESAVQRVPGGDHGQEQRSAEDTRRSSCGASRPVFLAIATPEVWIQVEKACAEDGGWVCDAAENMAINACALECVPQWPAGSAVVLLRLAV